MLSVTNIENISLTLHLAPTADDAFGVGWKHRIIHADWSDLVIVYKSSAKLNQCKVMAAIAGFHVRVVVRMWHYALDVMVSCRRLLCLDVMDSHGHPSLIYGPQCICAAV